MVQVSVDAFRLSESRERVTSGKQRLGNLKPREKVESPEIYAENQNLSQEGVDDTDLVYEETALTPYTVNMNAHYNHFDKHITYSNTDFKENIHRKVQTIQLEDKNELSLRVSSTINFQLIFIF